MEGEEERGGDREQSIESCMENSVSAGSASCARNVALSQGEK